MMGLLTFLFGHLFHVPTRNYSLFVLIGTVLWNFVARSWVTATNSLVAQGALVKYALLPRAVLPLSTMASQATNLAIEFQIVGAFALFSDHALTFGWLWLTLPLAFAVLATAVVGLGLATSALFVLHRDVGFLVETAISFLFWGSLVVLPLDVLPEPYRIAIAFNPFGASLAWIRTVMLEGRTPPLHLLASVPIALGLLVVGLAVFRHHEHELADPL